MRHSEIIDRLGGNVELAARLGRHRITVGRWRESGIPYDMHPEIVALAREAGFRVTLEQLTVANPRFGQRQRAMLRRSSKTRAKGDAAGVF